MAEEIKTPEIDRLVRYFDEFYVPPAFVSEPVGLPHRFAMVKEEEVVSLVPGSSLKFSVKPARTGSYEPKFEEVQKKTMRFAELARKYGQKENVDENLILAVISSESSGGVNLESKIYPPWNRAYGPMQITPATAHRPLKMPFTSPDAKKYSDAYKLNIIKGEPPAGLKVYDVGNGDSEFYTEIKDSENNIKFGTRYLKILLQRFKGDAAKALAAYNAGPNYVEDAQRRFTQSQDDWFKNFEKASVAGRSPRAEETKPYVTKNIALYLKFASTRSA